MLNDDLPNYDEEAVAPMRRELVQVGFEELRTADAVDEVFREGSGVVLLVINSVCGCAAGGARPGAALALQHGKIPDRMVTVFAGQDKAAVRRVREHLSDYPPSSPFLAVLRDGKAVHVMQRHDIEGKDARAVASELVEVFERTCSRPGPSIPADEFARLQSVSVCGSSIPPATVQIEGLGAASGEDGESPEGRGDKGRKRGWWRFLG